MRKYQAFGFASSLDLHLTSKKTWKLVDKDSDGEVRDYSLSIDANLMQKSSSFSSPSAKSGACHTQDFSFPACS